MVKTFESVYGNHIQQFIDIKRKLGFKYQSGAFYLLSFDRFANERGETSMGISRDLAEKWSEKKPNETEYTRYIRIRKVAQFSSYLRDIGIPSTIPQKPLYRKCSFVPYIYSGAEILALFKASDGLKASNVSMDSSILCMPALLRLLYSTGIRINEALDLKNEDVNLDEKHLKVRDSKNGKERIIPISDSLVSVCKSFAGYRDKLNIVQNKTNYFFIKLDGSRCGQGVRGWFKICLDSAGILNGYNNKRPRIHDLRHTFAVTSLASMADAGVDLYASLPILSNYLGHQSLAATDHYVRLTANMYPDLIKDVNMISLDVFPKFKNYEAD